MDSLDFMYIAFGLSALAVAGVFVYVGIHVVETLKVVQRIVLDVEHLSAAVTKAKLMAESKVLGAVNSLFGLFGRR